MSFPRINPEENLNKLEGLRFYGKDGWKPFVVDGKINPLAPVTSRYGPRTHPVHGGVRQHNGLDIGFLQGTRLAWKGSGNREAIKNDPQGPYGGYGNLTLFQPQGSETKFKFAHLDQLPNQDLSKYGLTDLGTVGSTGVSTGPHLHLEALQTGKLLDTGAKPSQSPTTATAPSTQTPTTNTAINPIEIAINLPKELLNLAKEKEKEKPKSFLDSFVEGLLAKTFNQTNNNLSLNNPENNPWLIT